MQQSNIPPSPFNLIRRILLPPFFPDDEDKTRLARGLHAVLLANTIIALAYAFYILVVSERKLGGYIAILSIIAVMTPLFILLHRGKIRLTSIIFVIYFWVLISVILFVSGGLGDIAGALYIPIITITLLFLGRRASLTIFGLTLAFTFIFFATDLFTLPNYYPLTKIGAWVILTVGMVMILTPIDRMQRELMSAVRSVREQLAERQKAEQTLRESEERFRLISSVTSDYTFASRFDAHGGMEHHIYSDAFETITGYTPEEFAKLGGWAAIVHPDDRKQDAQDMAMLRENKSVVTEVRIIRKDGQVCWVRVYGYPLWDSAHQNLIGIYGAVQNINERKLAELALQESGKRYRVISELISDYAYAYDIHPDGSFSLAWITEDSFTRLSGYDWHEYGANYSLYHPDDVQTVQEHIRQTIEGHAASGDYRIITKSGETRWIRIQRQVEWSDTEKRFVRFYGAAKDITEQKQAESALAQDRKLLRTVIDNISDNIYVKNRDGHFLLNNSASMRIIGVSSQEELLGKTDFDYFPYEFAQQWSTEQQQIMERGESVSEELFQAWHLDERRWLFHSMIPLHDENGNVNGLLGINRDISQHKRAEEAIREKEALLRALLDATPDIAFLMSVDGKFLTVNKPLAEAMGYTIEELLGKDPFELLMPDVREGRYQYFRICVETKQPVRWQDGRVNTWWDNSFYPVLSASGEVEAIAAYGKNITEEKRLAAELQRYTTQLEQMVEDRTAELRRAKEQIEIILNNTRDAIALARGNGDIEARNPAFISMFGEQVSKLIELLLWTVADDKQIDEVGKAMLNTIQNQEGQRVELRIVSESGGDKDIDLAFIPVQLTNDLERSGVLVSAHDVTHIRQIERFKTRFIDDAMHDLATPITGLTNRLYLMKRSPEKLDEHLRKLENQVEHLRNLLDDLRSLSKLDRGQLALNLEPHDINRIVGRVFDTYEPVAASKGQKLKLSTTPDLPKIQVDFRQMERVFVNLVANAVNYTPNDKTIYVETARDNDHVIFSVKDEGIGITPEDLPHVFERFYRTVGARNTETTGTGLGLAIVKEIVERHGGSVTAHSEPGNGSIFTVRLPIK